MDELTRMMIISSRGQCEREGIGETWLLYQFDASANKAFIAEFYE